VINKFLSTFATYKKAAELLALDKKTFEDRLKQSSSKEIHSLPAPTPQGDLKRREGLWIVPDVPHLVFSRIWANFIAPNNAPETVRFVETERDPGRLRIAIVGSGGIGDLLELTDVAEVLKQKFAPCDVVLFHQNSKAPSDVTALNPNVSAALVFSCDREALVNALKSAPFFDVIVAARYTLEFALTSGSRADTARWNDFISGVSFHLQKWKPFVSSYPFSNNAYGRKLQSIGRNIYDSAWISSGLNFTDFIPPTFFPQMEAYSRAKSLVPQQYVTIHNGFDRTYIERDYDNGYESTKSLPLQTWVEIVALLTDAGFQTVQLGLANETAIPGISLDLRGITSFSEMAFVLKGAQCHVDTEGGLVHVARRVNQRAVVMFGPTSDKLFGYDENINLASRSCGDCWWTREDWIRQCPRGTQGPQCMWEHSAASVVASVKSIATSARRQPRHEIIYTRHIDLGFGDHRDKAIVDELQHCVAELIRTSDVTHETLRIAYVTNIENAELAFDISTLGHDVSLFQVSASAKDDLLTGPSHARFATILNIPTEDQRFDLVVCMVNYASEWPLAGVIDELCRITKPDKFAALAGSNIPSDLSRQSHIPEPISASKLSDPTVTLLRVI
jgi:ADP-heptose:LPS heptosyltransferase